MELPLDSGAVWFIVINGTLLKWSHYEGKNMSEFFGYFVPHVSARCGGKEIRLSTSSIYKDKSRIFTYPASPESI